MKNEVSRDDTYAHELDALIAGFGRKTASSLQLLKDSGESRRARSFWAIRNLTPNCYTFRLNELSTKNNQTSLPSKSPEHGSETNLY